MDTVPGDCELWEARGSAWGGTGVGNRGVTRNRGAVSANEWSPETDAEMLERCRNGDARASAELWERHHRAGLVAARNIAPGLDADDLVAEAYAKILELLADGRGPRGAFRPYLYRVIRSLAADAFRSPEETSGELEEIPDLTEAGPWEDSAFDRNAAAQAFASLDERWQTALWYSEVEGMPPREVARIMGMSANGVSALLVRARDGLRSAWVEAHVNREVEGAACRSTLEHLQRFQRGKLTAGRRRQVEEHLDECASCARAAAEYSSLNRRLALVLATVFVGGAAPALLDAFRAPAAVAAVQAGGAGQGSSGGSSGSAGTSGSAGSAGAAGAGAAGGLSAPLAIAAVVGAAALAVGGVAAGLTLFQPDERVTPVEAATLDEGPPAEAGGTAPEADGDADRERSAPRERRAAAAASAAELGPLPRPASGGVDGVDPAPDGGPGGDGGVSGSDAAGSAGARGGTPAADGTGTSRAGSAGSADGTGTSAAGGTAAANGTSGAGGTGSADGGEPGDGSDPDLAVRNVCRFPGTDQFSGEAAEYGVIRGRVTDGGRVAELVPPGYESVDDGRGNVFTNILTGTEPSAPFWWWTQPLTPLSQWRDAAGVPLEDRALEDVTVELRFFTPDGRYSPWEVLGDPPDCP